MEFAQAAKGLGVKAIHGAEVDLDDGRHLTLLVDTQEGWRNLCRILTRAHAHTRERFAGQATIRRPSVAAGDDRGARRRAGVPERLRAPGRARRADAAPAAGGVRARRPARRAAAPVPARRPRAQPAAGRAGRAARGGGGGDGRRPRARALARAAAGRVRRAAQPHDARRVRAAAARQHRARARLARRRWRRASRTTRARSRRRPRWPSGCAST